MRDAAARPISKRAHPMMAYRTEAMTLCHAMDTHVRALLTFLDKSPYGEKVSRDVIQRANEVITDEVLNNIPAYECPNRPHPVGCRACGGKRWISLREDEETARDRVPICPESLPEPPS